MSCKFPVKYNRKSSTVAFPDLFLLELKRLYSHEIEYYRERGYVQEASESEDKYDEICRLIKEIQEKKS